MRVRRHLWRCYGDLLRTILLPNDIARQPGALPLVHGCSTAQIWQGKRGLPITAVGRAKQGKQCVILRYRQQLTLAKSPACRGKVARKNSNLADEWL